MSRVDDLIADLAPNGVEFRALGDIATTVSGLSGKSKSDFSGGNARYVSYKNAFANLSVDQSSEDFVKIREGEKQNQLRFGDVVITGSSESLDEVGMSSVVDSEPSEPLYLNSFCFAIRFDDSSMLLPGFAKYLFRADTVRAQIRRAASGVTRINVSKPQFMKVRIPVPPILVQREIMRILDQFTQLEGELKGELEARRSQYEHYRHAAVGKPRFGRYDWVPLASIADISTGAKPEEMSAEAAVPYVNAGNEPSGFTSRANSRGDTITIPSRGQGGAGHVGYQKTDFWCGPLCYRVNSRSSDLLTRFLFFFLRDIQGEIVALRKVGSIPAVNKSDLGAVLVPVVGMEEQLRVVDMLDRLDALVNDLTSGLPAEIKARRRQYEYYRDKLLSFKVAN